MPIVEVTLRNSQSIKVLERMADNENLLVGAGSVTSLSQLNFALRAGARFITTPGLEESVIRHCSQRQIPVIAGAVTPTEVLRAHQLALSWVKFFPCEAFGGLSTIEALSASFPEMNFIPTGGVHLDNLGLFLHHPRIRACAGNWMMPQEWIEAGEWDKIRAACRATSRIVTACASPAVA